MDAVVVLAALILIALGVFFYFSARRARESTRVLASLRVPEPAPRPIAEATLLARSQPPAPAASAVPPASAAAAVPPASSQLFDVDREPASVSTSPEIRWCEQFDPRSGTLDDTARLRLIGDLGVVAKEWCVPLLAAAYREEPRTGYRQAALIALAACRSPAAADTFRAALASGDAAERAIAADGLADLEPPPQTRLRRTVERH